MKKNLFWTINLVLISAIFTGCEKSPERLLAAAFDKCQSIDAGYYEMDKTLKLISMADGVEFTHKAHFKKMEADTIYTFIFHSCLDSDSMGKTNLLYTGNELIAYKDSLGYINEKGIIRSGYIKNLAFGHYWPVTRADSYPIPTKSMLRSGDATANLVGMEEINGVECYRVSVDVDPKYNETTFSPVKLEYEFWISKTDFLPVQYIIKGTCEYGGESMVEYEKCTLTKYEFGDVEDEDIFTTRSLDSKIVFTTAPKLEGTKLNVGDIVPDFESETLSGESFRLSEQRGRMVLLEFFYVSCPPCIDNIPLIETLHNKYKDRGLQVVNVNSCLYERKDIAYFIERHEIKSTVLVGSNEITSLCKVNAYPTIYLTDRDGNIIYSRTGGLGNGGYTELEQLIERSL